jgi:hypothetical protein
MGGMSLWTAVVAEVGLQDGLGWDDVFWFSAGLLTMLTVGGILVRPVLRELREFLLWWRKFQRDWDGEPAVPGRDAVPGFPERMNRIDGELSRNGGESLKDKAYLTWEIVSDLKPRVQVMEERQVAIMGEQANASRRLADAGH